MFLVVRQRHGARFYVFTVEDPRSDGFTGAVTENVVLDYDVERIHRWADGEVRPQRCLGQSKSDPNFYKVFKCRRELPEAEFQSILANFVVFPTFQDYVRLPRTGSC